VCSLLIGLWDCKGHDDAVRLAAHQPAGST
jgi:hypothetical protein